MELWAVRLERSLTVDETERLLQALPSQRRERLLRLRVREKWREPLCAYRLLQRVLQRQYGWDRLPDMAVTDRGKPWFPACPHVHFSISHTEGAVLVGIGEQPVGVDIESVRPVSRTLLDRFSMRDEESFFRLWVRREARGKCSGAGVGGMLHTEPPLQKGESYSELEVFPGYAAGVAVQSMALQGSVRKMTLEELLQE